MHDTGVVLAREDITGPPHVGSQLVDFVHLFIHDRSHHTGIPQIPQHEFVRRAVAVLMILDIDSPHPVSFALQTRHQMSADETAGTANQCFFHFLTAFP